MRWLLFVLPLLAGGQTVDAELGKATFRIYCAPCHGRNAEGGRGPDLTTGRFVSGDRDEDLIAVIENGVAGSEMRGYKSTMARDNVARLVAYIRSKEQSGKDTVTGDASLGSKTFWGKGACGACHRAEGRGANFGPDLSKIGRSRSAAHLRESLVDPDASLTPGFESLTVETNKGKRIVGRAAGLDRFSARLIEQDGTYHSFFIEELKSATDKGPSLMPSYRGELSETELDGLVAYMIALKGDAK